MIEFIKKQYLKYKEIINYLIFGVLTTGVNFIVYIITSKFLSIDNTISNSIAWLISVLFAYVTNKMYVFKSTSTNTKVVIKELASFIGSRLISGVLFEIILFGLLVNVWNYDDILAKVLISVLVVITNYVFSKIVTFRK